jgi:hypothetical protein
MKLLAILLVTLATVTLAAPVEERQVRAAHAKR